MFSLEELFCSVDDDFCTLFELMLVEHPTISDCGTNKVRWKQQLLIQGRGKTSVDWFYGFKLHLQLPNCSYSCFTLNLRAIACSARL